MRRRWSTRAAGLTFGPGSLSLAKITSEPIPVFLAESTTCGQVTFLFLEPSNLWHSEHE